MNLPKLGKSKKTSSARVILLREASKARGICPALLQGAIVAFLSVASVIRITINTMLQTKIKSSGSIRGPVSHWDDYTWTHFEINERVKKKFVKKSE